MLSQIKANIQTTFSQHRNQLELTSGDDGSGIVSVLLRAGCLDTCPRPPARCHCRRHNGPDSCRVQTRLLGGSLGSFGFQRDLPGTCHVAGFQQSLPGCGPVVTLSQRNLPGCGPGVTLFQQDLPGSCPGVTGFRQSLPGCGSGVTLFQRDLPRTCPGVTGFQRNLPGCGPGVTDEVRVRAGRPGCKCGCGSGGVVLVAGVQVRHRVGGAVRSRPRRPAPFAWNGGGPEGVRRGSRGGQKGVKRGSEGGPKGIPPCAHGLINVMLYLSLFYF
jgi:hypothetical protein